VKRLALVIVIAVVGNYLAAESGGLQLKQTIPLPGVEGRIDHLDLDAAGERLFVCALGNNTAEVLDLRKGERVHTISDLGAPQGLVYIAELNRLFIANDKGGVCKIYDAKSYQNVGEIDLKDDADNVRYDSATKKIYFGSSRSVRVGKERETNFCKCSEFPPCGSNRSGEGRSRHHMEDRSGIWKFSHGSG